MKFGFKNLLKSTPSLIKRLGNALLATFTFGAGYAFLTNNKTLATVLSVLGLIGKFITEMFYKNDDPTKPNKQNKT